MPFLAVSGGVFLEIVADIHFQLGPGLELFLPVVVGVHVGIVEKTKTDAMDAMEKAKVLDFDNFTRKTYWISTILPVGAQNLL